MSQKKQFDFRQCQSLDELKRMLHDKAEAENADNPSLGATPIQDAPSSTGGVQGPTVSTDSRSGSDSATASAAKWGSITGTISNQSDLWAYLQQIGTGGDQRFFVKYIDAQNFIEWKPNTHRMDIWIQGVLSASIHSPGWLRLKGNVTVFGFGDNKEMASHVEYNSVNRAFEFGVYKDAKFYRAMTISRDGLRVYRITVLDTPVFSWGFPSSDWVDLGLIQNGTYNEGRLTLRRVTEGCKNLS